MIERRLVGRRFVDFHPDAAHPLYPNELERRLAKRRGGDRDGTPHGPDALFPGKRRRPPVLFSGVLKCERCRHERLRARNLSREGRKHFLAQYGWRGPNALRCPHDDAPLVIEWVLQAGSE